MRKFILVGAIAMTTLAPIDASAVDIHTGAHQYRCVFNMTRKKEKQEGISILIRADDFGEAFDKLEAWFRNDSPHYRKGWRLTDDSVCRDISQSN